MTSRLLEPSFCPRLGIWSRNTEKPSPTGLSSPYIIHAHHSSLALSILVDASDGGRTTRRAQTPHKKTLPRAEGRRRHGCRVVVASGGQAGRAGRRHRRPGHRQVQPRRHHRHREVPRRSGRRRRPRLATRPPPRRLLPRPRPRHHRRHLL